MRLSLPNSICSLYCIWFLFKEQALHEMKTGLRKSRIFPTPPHPLLGERSQIASLKR
jgi:hypothetical protein